MAHSGVVVTVEPTVAQRAALAVLDGEPVEELHATVLYVGRVDDMGMAEDAASAATLAVAAAGEALAGEVTGVSHFGDDGEGNTACTYLLDVPGLDALRTALLDAFGMDATEQEHGLLPHLTARWHPPCPPGSCHCTLHQQVGTKLDFADLHLRWGDSHYTFALGGNAVAQPEEQTMADENDTGRWSAPMLVPEGIKTGDRRMIALGALTARDLPLSLGVTFEDEGGHWGAECIGTFETLERVEGGWTAGGPFSAEEEGQKARRMVAEGTLNGISVDLTDVTSEITIDPDYLIEHASELLANGYIDTYELPYEAYLDIVTAGKIAGATICRIPAFEQARVMVAAGPTPGSLTLTFAITPTEEGFTVQAPEPIVASAAPEAPPRAWFDYPVECDDPDTELTVTADGRVYGYVAWWDVPHIGYAGEKKYAPRSKSDYAHFRKENAVLCDDGTFVAAGPLTVGTGHADVTRDLDLRGAIDHYDNTGTVAARVNIGENDHGIWVAGTVNPDAPDSAVRALRASRLSGDWRPLNGRLEFCAALGVNLAGFQPPRTLVAGGEVLALVAAGIRYFAPKKDLRMDSIESRLAALEVAALDAQMERLTV